MMGDFIAGKKPNTLSTQSPQHPSPDSPPPKFPPSLKLPREIRDLIYYHALPSLAMVPESTPPTSASHFHPKVLAADDAASASKPCWAFCWAPASSSSTAKRRTELSRLSNRPTPSTFRSRSTSPSWTLPFEILCRPGRGA